MTRPLPQINELVTDDLIELHAEEIARLAILARAERFKRGES